MTTRTMYNGATCGLVLRRYEMREGPLGIRSAVPIGEPVVLRPGANEVDSEFAGAWLRENDDSDFVRRNVVVAGPER